MNAITKRLQSLGDALRKRRNERAKNRPSSSSDRKQKDTEKSEKQSSDRDGAKRKSSASSSRAAVEIKEREKNKNRSRASSAAPSRYTESANVSRKVTELYRRSGSTYRSEADYTDTQSRNGSRKQVSKRSDAGEKMSRTPSQFGMGRVPRPPTAERTTQPRRPKDHRGAGEGSEGGVVSERSRGPSTSCRDRRSTAGSTRSLLAASGVSARSTTTTATAAATTHNNAHDTRATAPPATPDASIQGISQTVAHREASARSNLPTETHRTTNSSYVPFAPSLASSRAPFSAIPSAVVGGGSLASTGRGMSGIVLLSGGEPETYTQICNRVSPGFGTLPHPTPITSSFPPYMLSTAPMAAVTANIRRAPSKSHLVTSSRTSVGVPSNAGDIATTTTTATAAGAGGNTCEERSGLTSMTEMMFRTAAVATRTVQSSNGPMFPYAAVELPSSQVVVTADVVTADVVPQTYDAYAFGSQACSYLTSKEPIRFESDDDEDENGISNSSPQDAVVVPLPSSTSPHGMPVEPPTDIRAPEEVVVSPKPSVIKPLPIPAPEVAPSQPGGAAAPPPQPSPSIPYGADEKTDEGRHLPRRRCRTPKCDDVIIPEAREAADDQDTQVLNVQDSQTGTGTQSKASDGVSSPGYSTLYTQPHQQQQQRSSSNGDSAVAAVAIATGSNSTAQVNGGAASPIVPVAASPRMKRDEVVPELKQARQRSFRNSLAFFEAKTREPNPEEDSVLVEPTNNPFVSRPSSSAGVRPMSGLGRSRSVSFMQDPVHICGDRSENDASVNFGTSSAAAAGESSNVIHLAQRSSCVLRAEPDTCESWRKLYSLDNLRRIRNGEKPILSSANDGKAPEMVPTPSLLTTHTNAGKGGLTSSLLPSTTSPASPRPASASITAAPVISPGWLKIPSIFDQKPTENEPVRTYSSRPVSALVSKEQSQHLPAIERPVSVLVTKEEPQHLPAVKHPQLPESNSYDQEDYEAVMKESEAKNEKYDPTFFLEEVRRRKAERLALLEEEERRLYPYRFVKRRSSLRHLPWIRKAEQIPGTVPPPAGE